MANVLILDVEAGIRLSLAAWLKADSHVVWCADAVPAAMAILGRERLNVVVCDDQLPGMDGMVLLRQMLSMIPGLQVIMMTGDPTVDNAAESLRAGAIDFLVKPVAEAALKNAIARAVRMGALEDENRRLREDLERLVQERTQTLQKFSARMLSIRDDERWRLARELHDSTAQQLSAVGMDLSFLEKTALKLPVKARQALDEARDLIAQCSQELRTLSYHLHPPLLDDVGLMAALREYARGFAARSGIAVDLDLPNQPVRFRNDVEISLFRIMQECLANIHRHAESTTAQVRLELNACEVCLQVRDQGCGMSKDKAAPLDRAVQGASGVGMASMRERIRLLGGSLKVATGPGGTMVEAIVPLEPRPAIERRAEPVTLTVEEVSRREISS